MKKRNAELKSSLKKALKIDLVCAAAIVFLSLLIFLVSAYYATTYPYVNLTAMRHNFANTTLGIFNGYTEKVPINVSLSTIKENRVNSIHEEIQSVTATIENLWLAFIFIVLFVLLKIALVAKQKGKHISQALLLLPVMFIASLLSSQYLLVLTIVAMHKSLSGISLFFVDSISTALFFAVAIIYLLIKDALGIISKRALTVIFVGVVLLIFFFVLELISNLGIIFFERALESTYMIHSLGIVLFALLFVFLLYLLSYIELHCTQL